MSKLILTALEERDCQPTVLEGLIAAFKVKTLRFPEAVVLTEAQAKGHFIANGEVMSNFHGIPLQIETKTDENKTVVKTINGLIKAMHIARVKEVTDVYQMLESTKAKYEGEKSE